jgi:hypothetical protein
MPRLQRRLPGGAFGSFASRFTGTAEELPGSVGAGVWVGAATGSEATVGSPVGLAPSSGAFGGILLTLTAFSCGK